ncbi:hypothetical protein [Mycobacteroides chelonae]|uniref:hypothetical protein n=1 Tax=Mycobacteroides chelonae TaxID=1774 RepID=UPI001041CED1|nr:hypothetical protein [Mycobacteroides chelonae]
MAWLSYVPIAISLLALGVSGTTLWRTQLSPFKLLTTAGPMEFRRHAFVAGDDRWYLPHLATTVGFTNAGAKPGRILDIRAVVRYTAIPIQDAYEVYKCLGVFDPTHYRNSASRRLEMMDKARIGDLAPFVVLPKVTETKFLVFDGRWETPVRQKEMLVDLEVLTDQSSDWQTVERWRFSHMSTSLWHHIESGGSFLTRRASDNRTDPMTNPRDLHKYTLDPDLDTANAEAMGPSYEITSMLHGAPVDSNAVEVPEEDH